MRGHRCRGGPRANSTRQHPAGDRCVRGGGSAARRAGTHACAGAARAHACARCCAHLPLPPLGRLLAPRPPTNLPTYHAGNVGDARITLIKASGEVQQLSVDHVPDDEEERKRIEAQNPNPKMPLVQVGGLGCVRADAAWRHSNSSACVPQPMRPVP